MTNQLLAVVSALAAAALIVGVVPLLRGAFHSALTGSILFISAILLSSPFVIYGFLEQRYQIFVFLILILPIVFYLKIKGKEASVFSVLCGAIVFCGLLLSRGSSAHALTPLYLAIFILPLLCLAFHQASAWIPEIDRVNIVTTTAFVSALAVFIYLPYVIADGKVGGYVFLMILLVILVATTYLVFFAKDFARDSLKLVSIQEAILLITLLAANFNFITSPTHSSDLDLPDVILRGLGLGTLGFYSVAKLIIAFGDAQRPSFVARFTKVGENLSSLSKNESDFLDGKIDDKGGAILAVILWTGLIVANSAFAWQEELGFVSAALFFSPLVHFICIRINDQFFVSEKEGL